MTTAPAVSLAEINGILARSAPLLPPEELRSFVARYLARADYFLGLTAAQPGPLYLLETAVLQEKARLFQRTFRAVLPEVAFYFAVKSNNHPEVAAALLQTNFGLDVSSGLELEMALALGCRDIVFSGPGKTTAELDLAVVHADRVVVLLDSFGELARLEARAAARTTRIRTGVRLSTSQTGLWRKFGIPPAELPSFLEKARTCPHIQLQGLQFHTSWNLGPEAQCQFIALLGEILADLPATARKELRFIDIGGGFWPPQGEWLQAAGTPAGGLLKALGRQEVSATEHYRLPAAGLAEFADRLAPAIRRHILPLLSCRICFEPGRWLCHDAMHLLMTVVDRKAADLVITDAGTNAVGWERFETDYFPVLNLSRPALQEKACNILGALCTPHDVWGYSFWGEDIQVGDSLLIPTQGAYTYSLRQQFIKPLPMVLVI